MGEKRRRKQAERDIFLGAVIYLGAALADKITAQPAARPQPVKQPEPAYKNDWQEPEVLESTVKK